MGYTFGNCSCGIPGLLTLQEKNVQTHPAGIKGGCCLCISVHMPCDCNKLCGASERFLQLIAAHILQGRDIHSNNPGCLHRGRILHSSQEADGYPVHQTGAPGQADKNLLHPGLEDTGQQKHHEAHVRCDKIRNRGGERVHLHAGGGRVHLQVCLQPSGGPQIHLQRGCASGRLCKGSRALLHNEGFHRKHPLSLHVGQREAAA